MTTFARIVNHHAVDVTTVDPYTIFHITIAREFSIVPDGTLNGATLGGDDVWTNPEPVEDTPPAPPVVPVPDIIIGAYMAGLQFFLDATAQAQGFDNIVSAVSYADEPAVPRFQQQGQAFRAWRSNVWATATVILNSGGEPPTMVNLVNQMPPLVGMPA